MNNNSAINPFIYTFNPFVGKINPFLMKYTEAKPADVAPVAAVPSAQADNVEGIGVPPVLPSNRINTPAANNDVTSNNMGKLIYYYNEKRQHILNLHKIRSAGLLRELLSLSKRRSISISSSRSRSDSISPC